MNSTKSFGLISLLIVIGIIGCNKNNVMPSKSHEHTNALIKESSPYLLQHAHNPVDWRPWGEEALNKAKEEDKMILISVGYAACHWCHVMEHESFEDSTVAAIMNENFICIKVDKEERPDVDNVYMTACQLSSGRTCGWPLNAFALPDGRPVWAGTYFPKDQWTKILSQFERMKKQEPAKLVASAEQIAKGMESYDQVSVNTNDHDFTSKELTEISGYFLENIDFKKGGRKGSPKFPMPNNYEYLLKYAHDYKNDKALEAVTTTLDKMALGGIYDQLGGGFARYSVDDIWLVPHFEKMLYDNGQLIGLYAQAYKKTKSPLYEKVIRESIEFVERELMSKEYGFYSSLDADSEGEEGKFYVWQKDEIEAALIDPLHVKVFCEFYDVSKNGNWEHTNILNVVEIPQDLIKKHEITEDKFADIIESAQVKLMKERDKRIRPGLDDKVLTSWNALMLSGLLESYDALGDPHFIDLATKNANFLVANLLDSEYRLDRNYKDGKSSINGFLEDYALIIKAFLQMYQVSFDEQWLDKAEFICDYAIKHFYNDENKLFNYTSDLDPPLVSNKIELSDNVIPAPNSVMARNLYQLGLLKDKSDYKEMAIQMMKNVLPQIQKTQQPNFYSNWCQMYLDLAQSPYEIAIVGPEAEEIRNQLAKNYTSNAILLGGTTEGSLSLLKNKLQEGETMIYVCQNKVCKFPVKEVSKALQMLER